ncbi:hypothetical protein GGI04_002996 [Coemansia thaxteri]|nr:hypothetical protein GGI04_002996 [Coemansia thaxteri]
MLNTSGYSISAADIAADKALVMGEVPPPTGPPLTSSTQGPNAGNPAANIIVGVIVCVILVMMMSAGVSFVIYRRLAAKRAAQSEKAAKSDTISEANTLV